VPPEATAPSLPNATTLLGAAKLSGQTSQGWTLGVFSALTDRESARLRLADGTSEAWPVEARATTTVARAVKSFDHGDSSFGLFAADLHRSALGPVLAGEEVRDALAVGTELQHRFGAGRYELRSWALASRLSGAAAAIARVAEAPQHYFQRPDAPRLHDTPYDTSLSGIAAETRLSRVAGAFLWDLVGRAITPGFDVDEIGFQRNSDWLLVAGTWKYECFRPGHRIRAWAVGSSDLGLGWTWAGEPRARVFDAYASINTRGYWLAKLGITREMSALSTDWLRGGPALLLPPRTTLALSIATDQRRASYMTLDASLRREPASGSGGMSVSPLWNVRSADWLQWSVGSTYQRDTVGWQSVARVDGAAGPRYVVARVRQETLAFTLRADLTFSPRLALQMYAQPFASVGRYDAYQRLVAPRDPDPGRRFAPLSPEEIDPSLAPDAAQRSLNASLVLRWEYRPGSFFTMAWNQQRAALSRDGTLTPGGALARLRGDPPTQVLLVKLSRRFSA
jgi:hypothetical protein